jgi:hypothetical protein
MLVIIFVVQLDPQKNIIGKSLRIDHRIWPIKNKWILVCEFYDFIKYLFYIFFWEKINYGLYKHESKTDAIYRLTLTNFSSEKLFISIII